MNQFQALSQIKLAIVTNRIGKHRFNIGEKVVYYKSYEHKNGSRVHQFGNHAYLYTLTDDEFEIYENKAMDAIEAAALKHFTENDVPNGFKEEIRVLDTEEGDITLYLYPSIETNQHDFIEIGEKLAQFILTEVNDVEMIDQDFELLICLTFRKKQT